MSKYAVITGNKIEELYDDIPKNWRNISGFNLLSDKERSDLGFVSVKQSSIIYDPVRHNLISNNVEIDTNGEPFVNIVVTDKITEEEFIKFKVNESIDILRNIRNGLLNSSDWAMTVDNVEQRGDTWKNSWASYRKQLRDITDQYISVTEPFDPYSVVFPVIPV